MTNVVKFGLKTFSITGAEWDSARQEARITFTDEKSVEDWTTAFGMSPAEQRKAIVDWAMLMSFNSKFAKELTGRD